MKEFDKYLNSMMLEKSEAHINLDKAKEQAYMADHKYRFEEILKALPISSNQIRILDIGATPFTLFIKKQYPHMM